MDEDIEAAFINTKKKIDKERKQSVDNREDNLNYNIYMGAYRKDKGKKNRTPNASEKELNFAAMGERGELYKKMADALKDKAKSSKGKENH